MNWNKVNLESYHSKSNGLEYYNQLLNHFDLYEEAKKLNYFTVYWINCEMYFIKRHFYF